jgi:hypothetical protein
VFRREPAFRQIPGHQVHPQVLGVSLAGLDVPLLAPQRSGIRRLGQVRPALMPGHTPWFAPQPTGSPGLVVELSVE